MASVLGGFFFVYSLSCWFPGFRRSCEVAVVAATRKHPSRDHAPRERNFQICGATRRSRHPNQPIPFPMKLLRGKSSRRRRRTEIARRERAGGRGYRRVESCGRLPEHETSHRQPSPANRACYFSTHSHPTQTPAPRTSCRMGGARRVRSTERQTEPWHTVHRRVSQPSRRGYAKSPPSRRTHTQAHRMGAPSLQDSSVYYLVAHPRWLPV